MTSIAIFRYVSVANFRKLMLIMGHQPQFDAHHGRRRRSYRYANRKVIVRDTVLLTWYDMGHCYLAKGLWIENRAK